MSDKIKIAQEDGITIIQKGALDFVKRKIKEIGMGAAASVLAVGVALASLSGNGKEVSVGYDNQSQQIVHAVEEVQPSSSMQKQVHQHEPAETLAHNAHKAAEAGSVHAGHAHKSSYEKIDLKNLTVDRNQVVHALAQKTELSSYAAEYLATTYDMYKKEFMEWAYKNPDLANISYEHVDHYNFLDKDQLEAKASLYAAKMTLDAYKNSPDFDSKTQLKQLDQFVTGYAKANLQTYALSQWSDYKRGVNDNLDSSMAKVSDALYLLDHYTAGQMLSGHYVGDDLKKVSIAYELDNVLKGEFSSASDLYVDDDLSDLSPFDDKELSGHINIPNHKAEQVAQKAIGALGEMQALTTWEAMEKSQIASCNDHSGSSMSM